MHKTERYICPFCCKAIDPERFHRVCTDPACTARFLERNPDPERSRRVSAFRPGEEVDLEASLFRNIDPRSENAVTTPYHIVYPGRDGRRCDICGKQLRKAICPICHNPVPEDDGAGSNIITVLGACGSGKSHYTSALLEVMDGPTGSEMGFGMVPATPRTDEVRSILKERLESGKTEACTSEPMVYYIVRDGVPTRRTLAFFDTAGADLRSEGASESISTATLITGSAGILFVVDPLSLPEVRRTVGLPPIQGADPTSRLEEIAETIRLNRKQRRPEVDVPLAVVMSKVDVIVRPAAAAGEERALFGPESSIHTPRNPKGYDAENTEQIGAEVEEYLRRFAGERFIEAVDRFTVHEYFAVSSLGRHHGSLGDSGPFRVEDPLVWMLRDIL